MLTNQTYNFFNLIIFSFYMQHFNLLNEKKDIEHESLNVNQLFGANFFFFGARLNIF